MFPLSHLLSRFVQAGTLTVFDAEGREHVFGGKEPGPLVAFRLHDRKLYRTLFLKADPGLGEAYMDGTLTFGGRDGGPGPNGEAAGAEGLRDFLRLFNVNRFAFVGHPLQSVLKRASKAVKKVTQYNPVGKAQQNVAHHYDLSRELYELFLDEDLQYSCALFAHEGQSLEDAQRNKKRHLAAKLALAPGQRVLDIGCGWGGLALYLAKEHDVHVTGVTLSVEQHRVACERAEKLGLSDKVEFLLKDYRELDGPFDRIVSVGMFEHVGVGHYEEFFAKVKSLLTPDGAAVVHSIGRCTPPSSTGPWLRKYIFPGGYSPSLSEVFTHTEQARLWVTDVEILRLHYAKTLRAWAERFAANRGRVAELYDERFCRMWEFYLICCEMAFAEGNALVFQMQLARDRAALPLTRDYMYAGDASAAGAGTHEDDEAVRLAA
ncbi:SAM-dependent methyltransferase [Alienimonas californiensis]|uniref:Cyclopropane-fatty-acyl-phospholipid synthase n=1 Tax=Alienimonas californiensis TaxID=2527989 RepID=A0A517P4X9_9PLAN|nr:cyclopropane-fatty-acyl-phospholipid synthase family protein [Alienimonas californiensis]QDT14406.1 Cyclopropane-fatty-acyl-phospholipid synthase [Alienimonas californiensis]